ncbi:MAG: hypothetical protein RIS35_1431 [Pseudomonadota bacterium]
MAHTQSMMNDSRQRDAGRTAGDDSAAIRARNLRTALILLSIALVFFGGIIVNRWLFVGQP